MHYRVINKDGNVARLMYTCFGMLSMVDGWYSEFKGYINTYDSTGEEYDWKADMPEEVDGCKYVPGFYPRNFAVIQYVPPAGSFDIFLDYPEILEHPLFKNVVMTQDEEGLYLNVAVEGLRMDETIYPLLFLRNVCEMFACKATFDQAIEIGAEPATALIFSSIYHVITTIYGNGFYGLDHSDSAVISDVHLPLGDLAELVKGETPPVYLDRKWNETAQGYSSYGTYAAPFKEWEPWDFQDDDGFEDEDDDTGDDELLEMTEPHPILNIPSSLTTPFCVKAAEEYSEAYRVTLLDSKPDTREEFADLIYKVESYE